MAAVTRERAMVCMTSFSSCNLYVNVCHLTLSIHKVLIINTFICKFNILYQIVAILRDNIVVLIRFQEFFLLMNSPLSCEEFLLCASMKEIRYDKLVSMDGKYKHTYTQKKWLEMFPHSSINLFHSYF